MGRQSQRDGADALLDRVARQRCLRFAAQGLSRGRHGLDAALAGAIERLPPAARRRLFLDPAFARLSAAPGAPLALCAHSTLVPLAAAGLQPEGPLRLKADGSGRLLFAGHPVCVELGAAAAGLTVAASWRDGSLRADGLEVPVGELLAGPSARRSAAWPVAQADGAECGSGTPFFAAAARRVLGGRWRPAAEAGGAAARLSAALSLLESAWPGRRAALLAVVRHFALSAPGGFEGSARGIPGAVFFHSGGSWFREKVAPAGVRRAAQDDAPWKTVEFLVHEGAHQALFLEDELTPLWTERAPGRRLRSPWTGVPRTAGVLGAGLHAYAQTLEALLRLRPLLPAADLPAADVRVAALAAGFPAGFAAARGGLRLTPAGERVLGEAEARVKALW